MVAGVEPDSVAKRHEASADVFGGIFDPPSSEPLAQCQWDMAIIHADAATRARADGAGVRVGIIDSGVDIGHPDIAPNLDLATSITGFGNFIASRMIG